MPADPVHIVVMGVSATGKTTVAEHLSKTFDLEFVEGDEYHSDANLAKMSAGIPLTDEDRTPWLETLAAMTAERDRNGISTVLTCSALRRPYRDELRSSVADSVFFLHLVAPFDVLQERMSHRRGHFMPPSMLQSQFDTLEPLESDEDGETVDVSPALPEVFAAAEDVVRRHTGL